jgi:hypothetical protein
VTTRTPFAMVPLWVYRHPNVTATMTQVYLALAARAERGDGRRVPRGVKWVMEDTGLGKTSVYDALATLRAVGAVTERAGSMFLPLDEPGDNPAAPPGRSAPAEEPSASAETGSAPAERSFSSREPTSREPQKEPPAATAAPLPAIVEESEHLPAARALCALFAELLEARGEVGARRKATSRSWVVAMEAMLRIDGREPAKVEWAIRWLDAGQDSVAVWWRPNIRSPEKLRLQYVRLAEQHRALRQGAPRAAALHRPGTLPLGDAARQVAAQAPNGAVRSAIPAAAQERP